MGISAAGFSHVAIRVTDLARAKQFYTGTLGFQLVIETNELFLVNVGGILLGVRGDDRETTTGDRFNPYRVGLDHLALAVPNKDALQQMKGELDTAGVPNNGLEDDALTGATFISFYDPDGIAWELYVMPA